MRKHVFISYKRGEEFYLHKIVEILKTNDIPFWYDSNIGVGKNWRKSIAENLTEAFAIIVIVTPMSLVSLHVTYEWSYAAGQGIPVYPLLFEGKPSIDLPLGDIQHIDFTLGVSPHQLDELVKSLRNSRESAIPNSVRLWQSVFNSDSPVTISMPLQPTRELELYENRTEYTFATTLPEAFALTELMQTFVELKQFNIIGRTPYTRSSNQSVPFDHNLVCIGGVLSNTQTKRILDRIPKFPYQDVEHGFLHTATNHLINAVKQKGEIIKDYGIIAVLQDKFSRNVVKKTCLFMGCYAYGTLGAARFFTSSYAGAALKYIGDLSEYVILIEVEVADGFVSDPEAIAIDKIE